MIFAVEFDPQSAVQVGSVLALLAWIVRVWLPKITDDFRQDMKEARADFKLEVAEERKHCTEELARADHRTKGWQQLVMNQRELERLGIKLIPPEPKDGMVG